MTPSIIYYVFWYAIVLLVLFIIWFYVVHLIWTGGGVDYWIIEMEEAKK